MASIFLKRSSTPNRAPSTIDLELGEVAINTHDGNMYIKQDDGTESIKKVNVDSTTELDEGTNLYFTTSRANTAIDNRVNKTFVDSLGVDAASVGGTTANNFVRTDAPTTFTANVDFNTPSIQFNSRRVLAYNSPSDHGAVGDYDTDDSTELQTWLDSYDGTPLYLEPDKVFRCDSQMLLIPECASIIGVTGPSIAPYNLRDSQKELLRPTYKDQLKGSVIIFSGNTFSSNTVLTDRTGTYANLQPMMYYDHKGPLHIDGITIIADVDVVDGNNVFTTTSTDNRQTAFDSGLVVKGYASMISNFCHFGYLERAGGLVLLQAEGEPTNIPDPDYITVLNSSITSGLVVIGGTKGANTSGGLSGVNLISTNLYGADYHEAGGRVSTNPDVSALVVDGDTTGSNAGIRGFNMVGGAIRGVANKLVDFGNLTDWTFNGTIIENPSVSGVTGLDQIGRIHATSETSDGEIISLSVNNDMNIDETIAEMGGRLYGVNGPKRGIFFAQGGSGDANNVSITYMSNDLTTNYVKFGKGFSTTSGIILQSENTDYNTFAIEIDNTNVLTVNSNSLSFGGITTIHETATIADDSVAIFNVPAESGHGKLMIDNDSIFPASAEHVRFYYDVGRSTEFTKQSGGGNIVSDISETTPTGTTGSDGSITVFPQQEVREVHIENRSGSSINVKWEAVG